jgi:hypothetical protein
LKEKLNHAKLNFRICEYIDLKNKFGAIAQLGERIAGSDEVRGSIPLGSTKKFISWTLSSAGRAVDS